MSIPIWSQRGHVPAEEQVRRQGVRPIESVDELAFPGVWESDQELVLDTDVASGTLRNRLPLPTSPSTTA
jgi:hypothetical protein